MHEFTRTQEKDVDLLLVDSGDLHDGTVYPCFPMKFAKLKSTQGTGITDGFPAGGVDAHDVRYKTRSLRAGDY